MSQNLSSAADDKTSSTYLSTIGHKRLRFEFYMSVCNNWLEDIHIKVDDNSKEYWAFEYVLLKISYPLGAKNAPKN